MSSFFVLAGFNLLLIVAMLAWAVPRIPPNHYWVSTARPGAAAAFFVVALVGLPLAEIPVLALTTKVDGSSMRALGATVFVISIVAWTFVAIFWQRVRDSRKAELWFATKSPNILLVHEPCGETKIELAPNSIEATIVGNGMSGPTYLQLDIRDVSNEKTLHLVAKPAIRHWAWANGKDYWYRNYQGALIQNRAIPLLDFLDPFVAKK